MVALINMAIPSHGGFYPLYLKEEVALLLKKIKGGIDTSSLKMRCPLSFRYYRGFSER